MANKKRKKLSKGKKILLAFGGIVLLSLAITAFNFYERICARVAHVDSKDPYLYIPTGSDYDDLLVIIEKNNLVRSIESFDWVARKMNLNSNVHAGRYRLQKGMSNYDLAFLLRSGEQEPVKLVLRKFRLKKEVVSFVSQKLEADSATLITALNDSIYLRKFGMKPRESIALFIPNTYEIYWNTSAEKFLERMNREYDDFWNPARTKKAKALSLTPLEVITMASIVEEETNYAPDKTLIASVYINRMDKGMLLQADPTVKFAMKDFGLRRILNEHLQYNSPYNTYLNAGLPPGPICTPSISTIDAVLQAERNGYLYFCADPDRPGKSVFAKTYSEHLLNAKRYQHWLNNL